MSYTNGSGVASFSGLEMPYDTAYPYLLTVSKPAYVTEKDTIRNSRSGPPGDANASDFCNVADVTYLVQYIFQGGPPPPILNRGDADGRCSINIADACYIVYHALYGGPAPVPGCVTLPYGGKRSTIAGDPNDHEQIPVGLAETEEIQVQAMEKASTGNRVIELNSQHSVYGFSLTLKALNGSEVQVTPLLAGDEKLELYWSQIGDLVKIGLIDIDGKNYIKPGQKELLSVTGDFVLSYSLAAEVLPTGETVTLRPKVVEEVRGSGNIAFDPSYPNPFNPVTNFSFYLPGQLQVTLEVYNILGRRVKTLLNDTRQAGRHTATWDGTDERGRSVASGIYFSRFSAGDFEARKKLVLLK